MEEDDQAEEEGEERRKYCDLNVPRHTHSNVQGEITNKHTWEQVPMVTFFSFFPSR